MVIANITYCDCSIGIVDQDIKATILFTFDLLKKLFDVFIVSMVTLYWDAFSSTICDLKRKEKKGTELEMLMKGEGGWI